jgi:cardiolipin synthase
MSRRMIPNAITVARLCALPLFLWLYSLRAPHASWPAAALVFVLAGTDVLDGWLARRCGWQSELGRVLDPVVDRIAYLFLVGALLLFGVVPWWAVVPLIVRDGLMLAGAALMLFHYREGPSILRGGRLANFTLFCGIELFILGLRVAAWPVYAVGAALYLATGFGYIWRQFGRGRRARPSSATTA